MMSLRKPKCTQCQTEITLSRIVTAAYAGDPQVGDYWGDDMEIVCYTAKLVHFVTNGEHRVAILRKPKTEPKTDVERKLVTFSAGDDPFLPLPAGQWRYNEDGDIEAHLSLQDLRNMKATRDVVANIDVRRDVAPPVDHNETPLEDLPALDEHLDELFGEDDSDLDDISDEIFSCVFESSLGHDPLENNIG